jgi:hypothetical protein
MFNINQYGQVGMGLNKYEGYLERWWLGSRMMLDYNGLG